MEPLSVQPKELEHFLDVANRAVDLAAEVLRDKFGRVEARLKGDADFVTEADTESQRVVCETIRREFPDHGFLGEEGGDFPAEQDSTYFWILDPLDGTTNYVHGVPFFSISLALACKNEILVGVVLDPMLNERFTAVRGGGAYLNGKPIRVSSVATLGEALISIGLPPRVTPESADVRWMVQSAVHCLSLRRTGSAALNMAYLAAGRFDVSWALTTKAWDVAAGSLLIEEAGGVVTNLQGKPLGVRGGPYVAAANRGLLEEFLRTVGSHS
ncbi:MAG: inositol monophosphatase [Thermogutta sp.]|uniref:inositol monophosphatase family protein n=1 Tax=Thermogutta sp. TaxID=1962930 RepID=UPI00198BD270|nr:inositol monophosphatase family protein [Thermogutta sp.]MBC7353545.1 inositol monophosphatase [Thermogutta sp.]